MSFEWAYRSGEPPWDIGQPQPAIVRLVDTGAIGGTVLDIGCGTGENALYAASRGLDVVGVDAAPTAIERARTKATERDIAVVFLVADALALDGLGRTFDVAIDTGLFHTFSDVDRMGFERSLHAALRPGARYFLLCFNEHEPGEMGPRRVTEREIRETFARRWTVDSIVEERFATGGRAGGARAWLASLTRV